MVNKLQVTIEIIVHATEDIGKILKSFGELFDVKSEEFSRQELTGHFENPITLLSAKITKKQAKSFVEKLVSKIPAEQMDELIDNIESRIQNSTLHLRLGKQNLVKLAPTLQEEDAVKLKIFTPAYIKKDIVKNYVELLKGTS